MGDRIEHVDVLKAEGFGLKKEVYEALCEKYEDSGELPGSSFLEDSNLQHCFTQEGDFLAVSLLWWQGEYSAHSLPTLIEEILPQFEGKADIVFTYESGCLEGYRLDNHKVVEHHVKVALGDPVSS